jgi:hypothetical protein
MELVDSGCELNPGLIVGFVGFDSGIFAEL